MEPQSDRSKRSDPRLSVVIPVFNEAGNLQALFERLFCSLESCGASYEVICVDDGSSDESPVILAGQSTRHPRLHVIRLEHNRGQHQAILEGFRHARGEWLVTLDADLQNPPEEIPALLDGFRAGHDVIGTYRVGRQDPWIRRLASRAVNVVLRRIWGIGSRDLGCMLRGYSRDVAARIVEDERRELFVPAAGLLHAINPIEIPVRHAERATGESKYSVRQLLRLSRSVIHTLRGNRSSQSHGG